MVVKLFIETAAAIDQGKLRKRLQSLTEEAGNRFLQWDGKVWEFEVPAALEQVPVAVR